MFGTENGDLNSLDMPKKDPPSIMQEALMDLSNPYGYI